MDVFQQQNVALLTEGVDRNYEYPRDNGSDGEVALLTEGVDRNPLSAKA